jgi:hypothetical protein
MTSETTGSERFTFGLIADVFATLTAYGYRRGDNLHVGRAVGLLMDLTETYEGRDEPRHVVTTTMPPKPLTARSSAPVDRSERAA